jgi:hypothetical protein
VNRPQDDHNLDVSVHTAACLEQLFGFVSEENFRRVPYADRYRELVEGQGGRVVNDHVAFRSLNAPMQAQPAGVAAFLNVFEPLGYRQVDQYSFKQTHLSAVHLAHPHDLLPKLFVSQLEVAALPSEVADMLRAEVQRTDGDAVNLASAAEAVQALLRGEMDSHTAAQTIHRALSRPWLPPHRDTVLKVNEVSQYGAWTLLHGNAVNHCTALINAQAVADWPDIEATVAGLRSAGVPMKDTIEGEAGSKLRQTATQAAGGEFAVTEGDGSIGQLPWTYAYYELAERNYITDEQGERKLYAGFLGEQTPGLFEMTRNTGK